MFGRNPDLDASIGQHVKLRGRAENGKAGALLFITETETVLIRGLSSWESSQVGKRVTAEGVLRRGQLLPSAIGEDGEVRQGTRGGSQWFLESRATESGK